jgi:hypothetical protein
MLGLTSGSGDYAGLMAAAPDRRDDAELPVPAVVMKLCSGPCGRRRWASDFPPDVRRRDGLQARCRECQREIVAHYREEQPEVVRATKARYRERLRARG